MHDSDVAINGDHIHVHVSGVDDPALDRSNSGLVQLEAARRRAAKCLVNEPVDEGDRQQHVAGGQTRRQGVGFDTKARRDPDGAQRQSVADEHHADEDRGDRDSDEEQRLVDRMTVVGARSVHRRQRVRLVRVVSVPCRGVDAQTERTFAIVGTLLQNE